MEKEICCVFKCTHTHTHCFKARPLVTCNHHQRRWYVPSVFNVERKAQLNSSGFSPRKCDFCENFHLDMPPQLLFLFIIFLYENFIHVYKKLSSTPHFFLQSFHFPSWPSQPHVCLSLSWCSDNQLSPRNSHMCAYVWVAPLVEHWMPTSEDTPERE